MSSKNKQMRDAAANAWPSMSRSGRARRLERLEQLTLEQAGELGRWLPATCSGRRLLAGALEDWTRDTDTPHPDGIDAALRVIAWRVYELLELDAMRRRQQRLALYDDDELDGTPPAAGVSPTPDPARLEAGAGEDGHYGARMARAVMP